MMAQSETYTEDSSGTEGWWSGTVDTSRSTTPVSRPTKRTRTSYADVPSNGLYDLSSDQTWTEPQNIENIGLDLSEGGGYAPSFLGTTSMGGSMSPFVYDFEAAKSFNEIYVPGDSTDIVERKAKMQTGCIPCLVKGIACDPRNPGCKLAMSDDWNLNKSEEDEHDFTSYTVDSPSLTLFRPDVKWRRSWRERHSLNFFVNFSAPQMAGFFDSTFWQRMVIQTSYFEPSILHAITAIGALHESILQRASANEKRKAQAMEFALSQCNKAIACLTNSSSRAGLDFCRESTPNNRLALTTCLLFTCFEAMQGRCDSAVKHALQGRRLLQATGRPNVESMTPSEEDDLEHMRPLVERLEVQATALLDKGKRPEIDTSDQTPPLPPIECIFSLDHAHNTLHTALNGVMRFMQGFHPTAPRDHIAVTMAEKYLRYAPWFQRWETAFTTYLAEQRESLSNMDLKRAMVLKANHLVGTMLASVDQSAGPVAYDAYEAEFKAIVDLAREVLAAFSCPPLPTLSGGACGTPYLSFSLWVTDPLWMAISRCRNPSIRQAAFTLLSQNPRQEGIWHAGPSLLNNKYMRRVEAGPTSQPMPRIVNGDKPPDTDTHRRIEKPTNQTETPIGMSKIAVRTNGVAETDGTTNEKDSNDRYEGEEAPETIRKATPAGNMRVRAEWVDLKAQVRQWTEREFEQ